MFEHVCELPAARDMYSSDFDVPQRHTLISKLRERRNFYAVEVNTEEKVLPATSRLQQLGAYLKAIDVQFGGKETATDISAGLRLLFGDTIAALDASGEDSKSSELDVVKCQLLRNEQRLEMYATKVLEPAWFSFNLERQ